MVIPPNASPKQRKALNECRHWMIRELIEQEKSNNGFIRFFSQRPGCAEGVEYFKKDNEEIRKTRKQYE